MISKGTTHNDGVKLAEYMTTGKHGERAELWQLRGFEATNIKDAFRDVEIMAGATKCEQPFFHVQVRNRDGETLTRQQWEFAADRIERMLDLTDQPRAISFHIDEKTGREHMHVAWSRIDQETLTAKPLPFFKDRLKKVSRELEIELGLKPVQNERDGKIKYAPTRAEHEQARRLGLDIHEIRNAIRECWDRSDCGVSFQTALEHDGLILARGDSRNFVVIDHGGGIHALSKRILDVSAVKIRDRVSDLDPRHLPGVEDAKEFVRDATRNRQAEQSDFRERLKQELAEVDRVLYGPSLDDLKRELAEVEKLIAQAERQRQMEKPAPVWDRERADREWHDAIINAAIEKEKVERQFVEPKERDGRAGGRQDAGGRKRDDDIRVECPLSDTAAEIRLAWSLSQSPEGFIKNLDECGYKVACVTREEAERSHINAAFARETGRFAPEYREGDYVAINQRGHVYSINSRTTGESREDIAAFMSTFESTKLEGIETTRQQIAAYKRPAPAREMFPEVPDIEGSAIRMPSHAKPLTAWQQFGKASWEASQRDQAPEHMRGPSADIWTAYQRSDSARAFVSALRERDITVAIVTRDDVATSQIDRFYATSLTTATPPKLREGDYVAIAGNGRVYNLNMRTTGESADRVQTFMAPLDKGEFQSVYAVLNSVQERAARHDIERQAFRDLSAGELKRERDPRPTGPLGRKQRSHTDNTIKPLVGVGKSAGKVVGKIFESVGNAVESLFAPTLTPQQVREGERARDRREAEGEQSIDFARYTAELAGERQEREREAARERERHGRER